MKRKILDGRYRILQKLGQGGFGDTFLAEDLHMPSLRRCVIKRLKPIANDPVAHQLVQDRFEREAVLLEKLGDGHGQIPCLYAYVAGAKEFYLIQEWIEGVTLQDALQYEGPWSSADVKKWLLEILPVLDFIHSQGLVHRDIKPDNIILRKGDRQPVLIDFGAVKETMNMTKAGSDQNSKSIVIGTPGFMASEQSIGRPVFSSDLYSLGLTAIYLLTGKLPGELPNDPVTGKILWRLWFQSNNETDEHLAAVLEQAIQPQAKDRFNDAQAMIAALQAEIPVPTPSPIVVPPTPQPQTIHNPTVAVAGSSMAIDNSQMQLPAKGMADWQKALLTGSVIGAFLLGGIVLSTQLLNRPSGEEIISLGNGQAETNSSATDSSKQDAETLPSLAYKESCGDSLGNASTWYRVVGEATVLERIKNNYCGDAFLRGDNTVQVASFASRDKTQSFIDQLTQETGQTFRIEEAQKSSPQPAAISQGEAANVVVDWLNCKQDLFDYPYNRGCGTQILTGKAFNDNIRRSDGQQSSVEWLESNGAYYAFANQVLEEVRNLQVVDGQQAIADVVVTEQRTLYNANGNIDRNASGYDQRLVRYNLRRVNGAWKIADYNTLEVIWRR
ncbi:protein kinase domain-containing protein [Picosynechococcus sp. PCC 11901]|uniref:protein kinase domain-containing protein n=1 Tax=Picosynechococcus sp. PCC 11901 TaxID=2579791 RepID=UPI00143D2F98|nr:IMS domain-containing protein [Picosynechococcus sp. PCC 11901]